MEAQQLVSEMLEMLGKTIYYDVDIGTSDQNSNFFCKVPSHLRDEKDDWHPFDPKVVSIGPVHMGKPELEEIQKSKWVYMRRLLQRHPRPDVSSSTSEPSFYMSQKQLNPILTACVSAVSGLEDSTRGYYSEKFPKLDKDAFTKMLVLDACFLIEWCCQQDDDVPEFDENQEDMLHDFLLIENQIPFHVLHAVYLLVFPSSDNKPKELVVRLRAFFFPNERFSNFIVERTYYINLLEFYCANLCFLRRPKIHDQHNNMAKLKNYVCYPCKFFLKKFLRDHDDVGLPMVIKTSTATDCDEAGIHIKATNIRSCIPHIMFRNRTLAIQHIHLNQLTYSRIRNITLGEEKRRLWMGTCSANRRKVLSGNHQPMSDYVYFLCSLVKSEADYKVLEEKGVVSAYSRDEGMRMFEKLKKLQLPKLSPAGDAWYIRDSIEKYVAEPYHRWVVHLFRDYFSSPWSIIGWVVGFVLLVLSIIQTVYTILGYYNNKN